MFYYSIVQKGSHMSKIASVLSLTAVILVMLAAMPWVSDYAETGHWPSTPLEFLNEITASCITFLLGALVMFLIYGHYKDVENLLVTDHLTGVYNVRFFTEKLRWVFVASRRTKIRSTLLFMDLDGFKKYNDDHGHMRGNAVLELMGDILRRSTRRFIDWPFRIGGDEFAVLMEFSDKRSAETLAHRLQSRLKRETDGEISLTIGISEIKDSMKEETQWIEEADSEMYKNKRGINGKGIRTGH